MPCRVFNVVLGALMVVLVLGPASAQSAEKSPTSDAEYYELYKVLADTMYQVEQNYVTDIDRRELMEAAIRGVLDKLDPYSNYISPEELGRFKTSVESQFGGIGIQITMERGQLKVLSPLVGSPAYRAGIQAGDRIVEIQGEKTEGITIDEAVRRLKGDSGSEVSLTVIHPGESARKTLKLRREIIQIETVMGDHRHSGDDSWDFMLDKTQKIGYIRITAFSRDTAHQVEEALKSLKRDGMRGLVVDLRFNPGGLLKSATDIADLFISDGLIVTTRGRNTKPREVRAHKQGTYEGFPVVVLVNRYSASASEIVSACLQDHDRAIVIGERTWGKGSVQNVIDLEEGRSALKLTTASYWRPSGKNIHRFPNASEKDEWGVSPNKGYEMKLSDSEISALASDRRNRDLLLGKHAGTKTAEPESDEATPTVDTDATDDARSSDDTAEDPKPAKNDEAQGQDDAKSDEADAPKQDDKPQGSNKPKSNSQEKPKADASKPAAPKSDAESSSAKPFVDRQLQKALDYLTTEMAKVE